MRAPALRLPTALMLCPMLACAIVAAAPAQATQLPAVHDDSAYTESGQASWYGPRHEGLRTTSGERFDSTKMTAAHASLPLGSYVRVTDTSTGRSIVVRVNDREPPHGVRCIDLSHEAANRLGFAARGVADVTLAQISADEAQGADEELAEAPDNAADLEARSARATAPHGRRHTHRARR